MHIRLTCRYVTRVMTLEWVHLSIIGIMSLASVGMREVSGVCQRVTMLTLSPTVRPFSSLMECNALEDRQLDSLYGKELEENKLWR